MMRQVQIAAGSLVVLGAILSMPAPGFYALSAAVSQLMVRHQRYLRHIRVLKLMPNRHGLMQDILAVISGSLITASCWDWWEAVARSSPYRWLYVVGMNSPHLAIGTSDCRVAECRRQSGQSCPPGHGEMAMCNVLAGKKPVSRCLGRIEPRHASSWKRPAGSFRPADDHCRVVVLLRKDAEGNRHCLLTAREILPLLLGVGLLSARCRLLRHCLAGFIIAGPDAGHRHADCLRHRNVAGRHQYSRRSTPPTTRSRGWWTACRSLHTGRRSAVFSVVSLANAFPATKALTFFAGFVILTGLITLSTFRSSREIHIRPQDCQLRRCRWPHHRRLKAEGFGADKHRCHAP
jgi:hypothetical protein